MAALAEGANHQDHDTGTRTNAKPDSRHASARAVV
jgi:hypothetical protein